MADRPEVDTAPGPIAAVDAVVLAEQLAAAMVRVPFRAPLRGPSNVVANLGTSVTREAVRSFMGYASSLPVDEFRSIEQLLDNVCRVVMPPVVASFGVSSRTVTFGGVPGVLYRPARPAADGRDPLPPRRRVHRHVAAHVRVLHRPAVSRDAVRGVRRRLPARTRVPLSGRRRGRRRRPRRAPRPRRPRGAAARRRRLGRRWARQHPDPRAPRPRLPRAPGGTLAVLPGGRPRARRALRHRERGARHPALEHPHLLLPPRRRRRARAS